MSTMTHPSTPVGHSGWYRYALALLVLAVAAVTAFAVMQAIGGEPAATPLQPTVSVPSGGDLQAPCQPTIPC
jgi:hypothetical protein